MLLRELVKEFLHRLPPKKFRLESQLEDASRSAISTLEEGWKRHSTKEYLDFLGFTQASLEEIKGDIYRSLADGFLKSVPGSGLKDLNIDLKEFKEFMGPAHLKEIRGQIIKGAPLRDPIPLDYAPLRSLKTSPLTYEMFMELINKTDYLLRGLVTSLQMKGREDGNWLENEMKKSGYLRLPDGRFVKSGE